MTVGDVRVTVVICTHNRAELLTGALRSVLNQSYPNEWYEVLVIDNASTDNTTDVVQEVMNSFRSPSIRLAHEPVPGIGNARNAGVEAARGEIIGFTDDDAIVDYNWVAHAVACFESIKYRVAAVGGQVIPRYDVEPPGWFPKDSEADFRGERGRIMRRGEFPSGNNMFIWKNAILRAGGFQNLGMTESAMGYGEETALFQRLMDLDESVRFYYSPDVVIEHIIPQYKTTAGYMFKRALMSGVYESRGADQLSIPQRLTDAFIVAGRVMIRTLVALPMSILNVQRPGDWLVKYVVPLLWECGRLMRLLGYIPRLRQRPAS